MSFEKKSNPTLAGLFIGIGVLAAGYFMANSFRDVKLANQKITVKGYAEKDVTSDRAKWFGSINARGDTQQDAYAQIQVAKSRVTDFLEKKGLDQKDFSYSAIQVYPTYTIDDKGRSTGEINFYNTNVTVSYESDDVELVSKIAKESEELIKEGVSFSTGQPMYLFSKLDDLKIELLGKASKDAKERAEEITSRVGSDIGAVRSAQQGVFQITSKNDTSTSGYGMYDTSSIEKTVKAVVTISFATK